MRGAVGARGLFSPDKRGCSILGALKVARDSLGADVYHRASVVSGRALTDTCMQMHGVNVTQFSTHSQTTKEKAVRLLHYAAEVTALGVDYSMEPPKDDSKEPEVVDNFTGELFA